MELNLTGKKLVPALSDHFSTGDLLTAIRQGIDRKVSLLNVNL